MRFRLVGSVRAFAGAQPVALGRPQERCLLGLLLLECNRPVPVDRLADLLWREAGAPARPRAVVQTYVSRLRSRLAPHGLTVAAGRGGYRVDLDPRTVDVHDLRDRVTVAADEPDPLRRLELLEPALESCHGEILGDVAPDELRLRIGADLPRLQLTALELYAAANLALGRTERAIAVAEPVANADPVREPLVAVLMSAYRAAGRTSEAVAAYHTARRRLADDLGLEPGPRMRGLYEAILRDTRDGPADSAGDQLPPTTALLVGRAGELAELDRVARHPNGPRTVVITGGAGMGKTTLAVHWARRRAGDFPHGQVYVDARGFGAADPATAEEIMTRVLVALGVDARAVPGDPRHLPSFYRRATAARRLVVVLDDVANPDQVRPVMPVGPGAVFLVTSRHRLASLTVRGEAAVVGLAPLSAAAALDLLTTLLPEHHTDPAALSDLADTCGRIPLFLRIGAANVRRDVSPATLVAAMRTATALDLLESDADPTVSARGALSLSYRSLPPPAQRLLRAAGRAPLRFVTPDSAAAMLSVTPAQARRLLDRIADVHLADQTGLHAYRLHDLVREFGAEQPAAPVDGGELDRLMRFYVHAVGHAARTATAAVPDDDPPPGMPALRALDTPATAMAWIDEELPNIVAVVRHCAADGPAEAAWRISRKLTHYFWIRRSLTEWRAINEAALTAARRTGSPEAVAPVLNALAVTLWTTNDLAGARRLFEEALAVNTALGRAVGQASNHTNLGTLSRQTGDVSGALQHTRTAIALGRRHGRPLTVANALLTLGALDRDLGELHRASRTIRRALTAHRALCSTDGQVASLNELASIHCELGHYDAAECAATESLQMADTFGSIPGGIFAREAMIDLLAATGRAGEAAELGRSTLHSALAHGDQRLIIAVSLRLAGALAVGECAEEARREVDRIHELAAAQHDVHAQVDALLILAQLPGQPRDALTLARASEGIAGRAGLRLREAKAQQVRGELWWAMGERDSARAAAAQAWPVLRRSGAKAWILRGCSVLNQV